MGLIIRFVGWHLNNLLLIQNRATNSLHNDTRLTIDLIDENDEIPQFIGLDENGRYPGSVAENLEPGADVITVTATDKDQFVDFKRASVAQHIPSILLGGIHKVLGGYP